MTQDPPKAPSVSRDLVRAVLEVRDQRHNETHAALVEMYQALVAELVEANLVGPRSLAERLRLAEGRVPAGAHGEAARAALTHVARWLDRMQPDLPTPHPERWTAPSFWPVGTDLKETE